MHETTIAIPSRRAVTNQLPVARRASSASRASRPARSAPGQRVLADIRTLEERRATTQTPLPPAVSALLVRVRSEYGEMPGLKLTEAQASRLWSLDRDTCVLVMTRLVEQGFLKYTSHGTYVRATD